MTETHSFPRFVWKLVYQRKWYYAGGVLSVILLDAIDMLPAIILREVTDQAQHNPHRLDVLSYATLLVSCYLLISILRLGWRFLLMLPSRTMERELRQAAYERLLKGDYGHVAKLKIGDVISTLSQDIGNIRMFMGPGVLVIFDAMAYLVFIPSTLFFILGWDALWVMLPFAGLCLAVFVVHRPLALGYDTVSHALGDLSQYVFEEAQGSRFFRAEGLIELRRKKYDILLNALLKKQLNIAKWELGLDGTLQIVIQTSYLTVLALAWQGQGPMAHGLGTLTLSLQLLDKLLWPLMSVSYIMNLYQQARAGSIRYNNILSVPQKVHGMRSLETPLRELHIEKLSLRSPDEKTLLHEIDLKLCEGEHVALVGPIGSGKTVLLQTLAGMWESKSLSFSRFTYDTISYHELDRRSLWRQSSFVPQTPQIFSRSLGTNISPHQALNEHQLMEAISKADLRADLCTFPDGLHTLVGEKGLTLSGGQKQRTLIARSFHSQARLYLWDDSISALDPATTRNIIKSLRTLDPQAILVLATHRLSALAEFDKILVLADGRITHHTDFDGIKANQALFQALKQNEDKVGVPLKEAHGSTDPTG